MIDSVEIPTVIQEFQPRQVQRKYPQMIVSATDNRKYQYGRPNRKYLYLWNYDR